MNIQDTHEIKKIILITIKLIFHYQVRQESYIVIRERKETNKK